jgi:glycosyltransferase involved in cell wall biosynthesis
VRILHCIATLDRRAGGPATSIRSIVSSYRELGHEGEIVTLDEATAPYLHELGCPVHALGPVSTTFGYTPRLVAWLRSEGHRFDGVVVHGLWQYLGYAVHRVFRGRTPYMVFPHGMLDPYFKNAFRLKHMKKWLYWMFAEYRVLRDARRVLFTSKQEAELAEQSFSLHQWNAEIVLYGAIAPQGDPNRLRQEFLDRQPSLRDIDGSVRPYVLFLGRIHPKKGCDLLVDAFAQIASKAMDLQLVFAGPVKADWKQELVAKAEQHGIESRIHWTGMLEGNEKWGALYGCEAFVLPSHQENFGIAVAEALACGKPVLISNKVNIWEQILEDEAGIVAEDNQAGTLLLLQQWISLDSVHRRTMEVSALQCFRLRFDMQKNVRELVRLFSEITSDSSDTVIS